MTNYAAWAEFAESIKQNKENRARDVAVGHVGKLHARPPKRTTNLRDPCRDTNQPDAFVDVIDHATVDASLGTCAMEVDAVERRARDLEWYDRTCRELDAMNAKAREDAEMDLWRQAPIYDSDADVGQAWPPPKDMSYLVDLGLDGLDGYDDDEDDDDDVLIWNL